MDLSSLEGYDLVIAPLAFGAELAARWAPLPWTGRREARWAAVDRPLMASAIQAPLLAVDGLRGTAVDDHWPRDHPGKPAARLRLARGAA